MARNPSTSNLEEPTPDDENSPCIGESTEPILVQADSNSGPEADEVYGKRWS